MPALQRTLSSRRNSRTSEETTVGANGVHCPWGMEQFDVSSLPDQPMSTFVPLTYNPDAQLAKKGTKRMPVALRKVVNRLARSSSDEVGPYGPLAADAPVQRLPAGWLNVFGVGSMALRCHLMRRRARHRGSHDQTLARRHRLCGL
jgi:hypothetical protein